MVGQWLVNGRAMVGQWLANGWPMVVQWLAMAGQWLANGWPMVGQWVWGGGERRRKRESRKETQFCNETVSRHAWAVQGLG